MTIRVVHHSKTVGLGGTDKVAQIFCSELNRLPDFEAFLVYRDGDTSTRLDEARAMIGHDRVIPFHHEYAPNCPSPYFPASTNLPAVVAGLQPDIFHLHRSGHREWPGFKYVAPQAKLVETNIFGYYDEGEIDHHLYISDFIADRAGRRGSHSVLYNPTLPPFFIRQEARPRWLERLGLSNDVLLLGRVGRQDNFTDISLKAFARLNKSHPHAHYVVVNPCPRWRQTAKQLRLRNIHFVEPITSDEGLSEFYSALDIYAHARVDGECCPCNIQEAMYHGLPVVSHDGDTYQGQREIIAEDCGIVVGARDWRGYYGALTYLADSQLQREKFGLNGVLRAVAEFDATKVTARLAGIYKELLA